MDRNELNGAIVRSIHAVASVNGFSFSDKNTWTRSVGWKTDRIVFLPKTLFFLVNLDVLIPPREGSGFEYEAIAFANLGNAVGDAAKPTGATAAYKYPAFNFGASRVLRQVDSDLQRIPAWFCQFATPQMCLVHILAQGVNSHAGRPGSPSYEYCRTYLERAATDPMAG